MKPASGYLILAVFSARPIGDRLVVLVACIFLFLGHSIARAQIESLMEVNWQDPFLAEYLESLSTAPGDAAKSFSRENEINFSLPVLGLPSTGDQNPNLVTAPSLPLKNLIEDWPTCATARADIMTVPENRDQLAGSIPGSWYTRTFDFGCMQIVVEGDRNIPDRKATIGAIESQAQIENGTIEIDYYDENDGQVIDNQDRVYDQALSLNDKSSMNGNPEIAYRRGNLTFGIYVFCVPASQRFCSNPEAIRDLVRQFITVGGQPN